MTRDEQWDEVMNDEGYYRSAKAITYHAMTARKRSKKTEKQRIEDAARAMQQDFGPPFTIAGCREIAAVFVQELVDEGELYGEDED